MQFRNFNYSTENHYVEINKIDLHLQDVLCIAPRPPPPAYTHTNTPKLTKCIIQNCLMELRIWKLECLTKIPQIRVIWLRRDTRYTRFFFSASGNSLGYNGLINSKTTEDNDITTNTQPMSFMWHKSSISVNDSQYIPDFIAQINSLST